MLPMRAIAIEVSFLLVVTLATSARAEWVPPKDASDPEAVISAYREHLAQQDEDPVVGRWDAVYFLAGKKSADRPDFAFFSNGSAMMSHEKKDELNPAAAGTWTMSNGQIAASIGKVRHLFRPQPDGTWLSEYRTPTFDKLVLTRPQKPNRPVVPDVLRRVADQKNLVGTWRVQLIIGNTPERVVDVQINPNLSVTSAEDRIATHVRQNETHSFLPRFINGDYVVMEDEKGNLVGLGLDARWPQWFIATCIDPFERWALIPNTEEITLSGEMHLPDQRAFPRRAGGYRVDGSLRIHCANLTIEEGTVIRGPGSIWIWGTMNIKGKKGKPVEFDSIKLFCDLGGNVNAQYAQFENFVFGKNGPWFYVPGPKYSGRWTFDFCTFSGGNTNAVFKPSYLGIKLTNCVFEDFTFDPIEPPNKDYAAMLTDEWRTIWNCTFRGSRIPLSILWIARNCDFYSSTFLPDEPFQGSSSILRSFFMEGPEDMAPESVANETVGKHKVLYERVKKPFNPALNRDNVAR